MSRSSKFLQWINYRIRVTIQDSRMLVGTFIAFDKHMNLVLADTEEYRKVKPKKPEDKEREQKRALGLVLLRGENIVTMSAEAPPSQPSRRIGEGQTQGGPGRAQPMGRATQVAPLGQSAPQGLAGPGRGVGTGVMMQGPPQNMPIRPPGPPQMQPPTMQGPNIMRPQAPPPGVRPPMQTMMQQPPPPMGGPGNIQVRPPTSSRPPQ